MSFATTTKARSIKSLAVLTAAVSGWASACRAEPIADFYKGRQISMIIAHEVATGYDLYARLLARHMGRHIPGNPTFVPQNMLGASGITGANLLYNISAKDGSVIGQFAHTVPLDPLIGQGAGKFDASKFLVWWFDTHYIWSTLLTPQFTVAWAFYNDLVARAVVAIFLFGGFTVAGAKR